MQAEIAIAGYRMVGPLARGGYRAIHLPTSRRVRIDVAPHDEWREAAVRMLRTVRMLEALQHSGVTRIVDHGVLADHRPWLATELPNGIALHDLIARRTLRPTEVIALVHDVADVLAYAHARGVVHHALTVHSIVFATGSRGFPLCITDWGVRVDDSALAGASSDVLALGAIAQRAVTGAPPKLGALIARMLAIDPAERPTAAEVRSSALVRDDDHAPIPVPRFTKPKWTPAPLFAITSERGSEAAGEIVAKPEAS